MMEVEETCCGVKDICCHCYAKYFARRKLDQKTSNHSTYNAFELEPSQQKYTH